MCDNLSLLGNLPGNDSWQTANIEQQGMVTTNVINGELVLTLSLLENVALKTFVAANDKVGIIKTLGC